MFFLLVLRAKDPLYRITCITASNLQHCNSCPASVAKLARICTLLRMSVIFLNFGCINILVAVMVEHIVSIAAETRESFSKAGFGKQQLCLLGYARMV